ncbi:DUF2855 family protein [Mycolicibacterium moriokaense]|uniref:DUF2855 family protein n=1 Tax=Mycolicibacterium moriokaense TaxID=39691 RepID=UPI001F4057BC|nr:DUF2855 family protein [Mycolicibacterium moriokaense]
MDLELNRKDLHDTRIVHADPPSLADGEALLRVESFGLTANNITYAVFGDAMNYWAFFPASDPDWGKLNVWGYAHVEETRNSGLRQGMRVYGYLPCASHLVVTPSRIDTKGFFDAAPHRANLPSAYQGYRDVETDPVYSADREAEHILFFPLFFTSFLIDDFLADENFFGTDTVVISSASSKTAIIAAYLLAKRDGVNVVGLTSNGNRAFVESLNIYDDVHLYDAVAELPGDRAVYVDISGDGAVRTDVHSRYGDRLAHSATVGATHWTQMAPGPSAARTGEPPSSTGKSRRRGSRSRNGPPDGCASSGFRPRTKSSGPTSSCSTPRWTRRRASSSRSARWRVPSPDTTTVRGSPRAATVFGA